MTLNPAGVGWKADLEKGVLTLYAAQTPITQVYLNDKQRANMLQWVVENQPPAYDSEWNEQKNKFAKETRK